MSTLAHTVTHMHTQRQVKKAKAEPVSRLSLGCPRLPWWRKSTCRFLSYYERLRSLMTQLPLHRPHHLEFAVTRETLK